jgi:GntR family transcriptional regulator
MQDKSVPFEIHPSSGVPIYRQIMDQVLAMIASGRLAPGDLLPSVRQLGADLEVNMMTVSKGYARLEADGVLERVRGKGMRVKPLESGGRVKDRQQELKPLVDPMVTRAQQLGLTDEQVIAVVKSVLRERRS